MNPLDLVDKALNSKTVEKVYDDVGSKPAKQVGEFGEDLIKAFRLGTFPVQLLAAAQDMFKARLDRAAGRVPEERRIPPQPQIVGPIYENSKYLDDNTILYEMFEELLVCSLDKERIEKAHPSFIHLISQLSRDEAIILYELKKGNFEVVDTMDIDPESNGWKNLTIEKNTVPKEKLWFPKQSDMYCFHLQSLNLITWPVTKQDPIMNDDNTRQIGIRRYSKMHLTEFGTYFVNACIPEGGFKSKEIPVSQYF